MFDADQVLFDHVWKTLPDSISDRREVLNALVCKLKSNHPAWSVVNGMLAAIKAMDELQAQLPFKREAA